jgi:hypothetical protein
MPWPFATKKKTFSDRYPEMQQSYQQLNQAQKKVLDEFASLELKNCGPFKSKALKRIMSLYVMPTYPQWSGKAIKNHTKFLYDRCTALLQRADCTTNVPSWLFLNPSFLAGDDVKTVWTYKTGKPFAYNQARQNVEEDVFGYKIDWSIPIRQAAETRPVYAGLNYTEHPYGSAVFYGSVNCVLKREVKSRATFINADTFDEEFKFGRGTKKQIAASKEKICTAAHLEHLIAHIDLEQLTAICQNADGRYVITDQPPKYIEAQIHGGIHWDPDLAAINVAKPWLERDAQIMQRNPDEYSTAVLQGVTEFAERHHVEAFFYEQGRMVRVLHQEDWATI